VIKKTNKLPFIVRVIALLVLMMGLIDVWSAISPGMPQRLAILQPIFPYLIRSVVRLGTLLVGFFLIYLSGGLRKGKQVSWIMSMVILLSSAGLHLIKGLDVEEFAITIILILLLLLERKHFTAKPDIPSIFHGLRVLFFSFLFTSFYGILGMYILEGRHRNFTFTQITTDVVKTFFLVGTIPGANSALVPIFTGSIYLVGFVSLFYSLFMLFRPIIYRSKANQMEVKKVKDILSKYSRYSLQNNILLFGKHYFFGSQESSFIAYKQSGNYCLVLGFPVGPESETESIIKEFIDFCSDQGRKPVFCNIEPENLGVFKNLKYKSVAIGNEAFIDPQTFSLEGGKSKHLRQAVKKMDTLGYSIQVYSGSEISQILWRLRNISKEWLSQMHGSEKLFTVGKFDEKYLAVSKIIVLSNKEGHIAAFVNFNDYGDKSLIVDLMRHGLDVLPETMPYLFIKLFWWAKENGYKKISLGNASLYGVGGPGRPITEKAFRIIFERFNNFYNFKGLYTFKSKFSPVWAPRYIVYPLRSDVVPALSALLSADSQEGLVKEVFAGGKK